jgi:ABC-type sugar transport system substrate-binding protein
MKARRSTTVAAAAVAAAALLAGCSTGSSSNDAGGADSSAAPVATALGSDTNGVPAAITAAGGTELLTTAKPKGVSAQYGPVCKGADLGIGKIDFKTDTIGWAQSEKEANPFRIASTKSQIDTAKAKGWKLLTTNAQSNVQQENSDIKGMIDKGAKAIIFSPINSTGLGDAIAYAKSKKVAMIPVDRNITGV